MRKAFFTGLIIAISLSGCTAMSGISGAGNTARSTFMEPGLVLEPPQGIALKNKEFGGGLETQFNNLDTGMLTLSVGPSFVHGDFTSLEARQDMVDQEGQHYTGMSQ